MLLAITDQAHIFLSSILRQIVKTAIGEKKKIMSFAWTCIYTILWLDEAFSVHANLCQVAGFT